MLKEITNLDNWELASNYRYTYICNNERSFELLVIFHTNNTPMETSKAVVHEIKRDMYNTTRTPLTLAPNIWEGTIQEWLLCLKNLID